MGKADKAPPASVSPAEMDAAMLRVANSPDYRLLRRIKPESIYTDPARYRGKVYTGVVVDSETTGTNTSTDLMTEVGLLPFHYGENGEILDVIEKDVYSGLQDPGRPLSAEIKDLTGLTDDMLRGKQFDIDRIEEIIGPAHLLIAHNAEFDRKMCERLSKKFADKMWGCSQTQIPWKQEKIYGTKLEYIATRLGYFYDAHRALDDSRALLHLLALPLPLSDRMPLQCIRENLAEQKFAIWAMETPFDIKNDLYDMGFRWSERYHPQTRAVLGKGYRRIVPMSTVQEDTATLIQLLDKQQRKVTPIVEAIDPINLFSVRN